MADKEKTVGDPGGDDGNTDGDGGDQPGADDKSLESADAATLIALVRDGRKEAKTLRARATTAEASVGTLTEAQKTAAKELEDLKKAQGTAEEQEAARITELEAQAAIVPTLQPYHDHVKTQYDAEMATVEEMKDEVQKARYMGLINAFPETDMLGRMNAIGALRAAEGTGKKVADGDEGNPGQPGGGDTEKTVASKLAWSSAGQSEAKMAGLIK